MTLLEWIESQPFHYTKVNERPWGTYELQVTIDGRTAHLSEPHGWGWNEKEAFESTLTGMVTTTNFHQNLKAWLGEERFNQITSILGGVHGKGNRAEVSGEIKRLEEVAGASVNRPIDSGIPEQGGTHSSEIEPSIPND